MKKLITFGVFDCFHIGHLNLFEQAKEHGDYLVVAVQDGECAQMYKPDQNFVYSTEERVKIVSSLRVVDEVIVYQHINENTIPNYDFDILCLGEDHTTERFQKAAEWCLKHGKEVVRLKRTPGICATDLRKHEKFSSAEKE